MTTRDRDASGRPANARPRDALGRPLARGQQDVGERVPQRLRTPTEALDAAQDYFDRGLPFQAHEVLEDQWKASEPRWRGLWQGLAQLAVALTHHRRGNLRGAASVSARAVTRLEPYASTGPYDIDVPALLAWGRALAADPSGEVPVPVLRRIGAAGPMPV
ncbi:DUF309 domain-containing protein [Raineyella sp. LH-20]|uniref:DUF309 domain-containing protein n=1 Tax=Raineyella sp. LH-20 TaxID=3081204 RepID=UPI0029553985|nr:DUF309 domain-containing protein [Raineyella sp. LH-20]WOP18180.1 DUF309 domain-containing protein [Raineyella sp. LH-20]